MNEGNIAFTRTAFTFGMASCCGLRGARLSLPQPHGPVPTVSSSPAATVDTKGFKEKGSQFRVKGVRFPESLNS